jgi:serine/threonine protein kinase/Tfp pilus assembly protein PilF
MRIGPYEVTGELGRGGAGVVYRARSRAGRELAIKVLSEFDADSVARFARERKLLETVGQEDGFVPLVDAGETPGGPWVAMPFLPGGTLRERMTRPFTVDEAAALGLALATALGKAHARGIVHRDLKPANILLDETGRPLIADLGLAKVLRRSSARPSLTEAGAVGGTAGYMPPEQMESMKDAGPQADVFALGVILYECLARQMPFPFSNFVDYADRIGSGEHARPLRVIRPDVPPWLDAVIARALAFEPAERFADGVAMTRALAGARGAPRKGRAPGIAIALAALLLAGATVGVALRGQAAPPPASPPSPVVERPHFPTSDELVRSSREKLARDDDAGALGDATRAVELDPRNALAWDARGLAKERIPNSRESALADFDRSLELDPASALVHVHRAGLRAPLDVDGALDDVTRAIERAPENSIVWETRGSVLRWRWNQPGNLERIAADASKAIELDPTSHSAWNMRGFARCELGDVEGGSADLEKAVELMPRPPRSGYLIDLGNVQSRLGKHREAVATFERTLEINARDSNAWYGLAVAHASLGDREGAIRACEQVIAIGDEPHLVAGARDLLSRLQAPR